MTTLVTGASGFIGGALAKVLSDRGMHLHLAVRRPNAISLPFGKTFVLGDIDARTDWREALAGVETIIHTAGIAHNKTTTAQQYIQTNVEAVENLATMAVAAAVKNFIFISSVGVHGRVSQGNSISETSAYAPYNDYSHSKVQAEEILQEVCKHSSMALTIVRPPLVYAAHAPGNFGHLMRMIALGIPLPIGSVNNARAIIALENLVDFLVACIAKPEARNQIFLIADEQPVSTRQIASWLAQGMGKPKRLLRLPQWMVYIIARLLGQEERYQQLCGDLILNTDKAQKLMGWRAPTTSEIGIIRAGAAFIRRQNSPVSKI